MIIKSKHFPFTRRHSQQLPWKL